MPVRPSSISGLRPIAKPILASECLKDDIAPIEPFPRVCRVILGVAGAMSIAGAALLFPTFPAVAGGVFAGGALAAIGAALPSYRLRAAVGALGALAVAGSLVIGERSWALRACAAIVLASALFTRASYRAHRGVRIALAAGVALLAASAATSFGAQPLSKIAAGAMGLVALGSLLGFMGEQTTGGSALWASLALLSVGASIAVVAPVALVPLAAVATLFVATVAASTSIFALAASVIAPDERAREHRASIPPPSNINE